MKLILVVFALSLFACKSYKPDPRMDALRGKEAATDGFYLGDICTRVSETPLVSKRRGYVVEGASIAEMSVSYKSADCTAESLDTWEQGKAQTFPEAQRLLKPMRLTLRFEKSKIRVADEGQGKEWTYTLMPKAPAADKRVKLE